MARTPRESKLDSRTARLKLKPRRDPYWRVIVPGLYIGYRRLADSSGTWVVRRRVAGRYAIDRFGIADDFSADDRVAVFTYAQAIEKARRVVAGEDPVAPRHHGDGWTVLDCLNYYFETELSGKRGTEGIRPTVMYHVADLGPRLVNVLRAEHYRTWLAKVAASPVRRRGRETPVDLEDEDAVRSRRASANRVWGTVRAAIDYAWCNDKLKGAEPHWKKVSPLDLGEAPVPRMLDDEEARRLINGCDPEFRPLVKAAFATGARYGELCRLVVSDYDYERRAVRIRQTKSSKTLWQPLTDEGVELFDMLTAGRKPSEPLLARVSGLAWGPSEQFRRMRSAAENAKLDDVSFKVTRATYGKRLLLATRDIELVAKALGHSDSRVTRRHYAQYLPNEVAEAIRKLGGLGLGSGKGKQRPAVVPLRSKKR